MCHLQLNERTEQENKDKVSDFKFIITYNRAMHKISKIVPNNWSILHANEDMKEVFLPNSLTTIYSKEINLKEILSPSLLPPKLTKKKVYQ